MRWCAQRLTPGAALAARTFIPIVISASATRARVLCLRRLTAAGCPARALGSCAFSNWPSALMPNALYALPQPHPSMPFACSAPSPSPRPPSIHMFGPKRQGRLAPKTASWQCRAGGVGRFTSLFLGRWPISRPRSCPRSSGVEHSLGKGEVSGSIPLVGTTSFAKILPLGGCPAFYPIAGLELW